MAPSCTIIMNLSVCKQFPSIPRLLGGDREKEGARRGVGRDKEANKEGCSLFCSVCVFMKIPQLPYHHQDFIKARQYSHKRQLEGHDLRFKDSASKKGVLTTSTFIYTLSLYFLFVLRPQGGDQLLTSSRV